MNEFCSLSSNDIAAQIATFSKTKRVFLVHGKNSFTRCGAESLFTAAAEAAKAAPIHFTDFSDNPKWEDAQKGVALFTESNADCIMGIGGGSVLDTAKLIRFFSSYSGTPDKSLYTKQKDIPPLVLFPTTAGTGSEATRFAVCYVNGTKYSVLHEDIFPTKSCVDAVFTHSASPYVTACTGFDAFAQAVESYWSVNSTEESRHYAKEAIRHIYSSLPECVAHPTAELREKMARGAHLAGKAINISFTTAPHAYSYGITTLLGLPHGHAVACTFPYFFGVNLNVTEANCADPRGVRFVKDRMGELCALLGVGEEEAATKMSRYRDEIFSAAGKSVVLQKETFQQIKQTVNQQRLSNNPVKITGLEGLYE